MQLSMVMLLFMKVALDIPNMLYCQCLDPLVDYVHLICCLGSDGKFYLNDSVCKRMMVYKIQTKVHLTTSLLNNTNRCKGSHLRMALGMFAYPALDDLEDRHEQTPWLWYCHLPYACVSHAKFYTLLLILLHLDIFIVAYCAKAATTNGPRIHLRQPFSLCRHII